jgi:poly [ADP-ribose] polymerase
LCEVALGNENVKLNADYYAANLPDNKHSTKGEGKIQPDPNNQKTFDFDKDVVIPMGPAIESHDPKYYLRYNEFIVYDIAQIKIRYLLRLKFNYSQNQALFW